MPSGCILGRDSGYRSGSLPLVEYWGSLFGRWCTGSSLRQFRCDFFVLSEITICRWDDPAVYAYEISARMIVDLPFRCPLDVVLFSDWIHQSVRNDCGRNPSSFQGNWLRSTWPKVLTEKTFFIVVASLLSPTSTTYRVRAVLPDILLSCIGWLLLNRSYPRCQSHSSPQCTWVLFLPCTVVIKTFHDYRTL
jgi:hypothetical protein